MSSLIVKKVAQKNKVSFFTFKLTESDYLYLTCIKSPADTDLVSC